MHRQRDACLNVYVYMLLSSATEHARMIRFGCPAI